MNSGKKNIKIVPIGNSRGIRLSKLLLKKYGFHNSVVLEEKEDGIFLRKDNDDKLSWDETFKNMAEESEDWSDMENAVGDGIE